MIASRPQHIKLNNDLRIREAISARGEATTADIVEDTGLSQTTVGQAIEKMRLSGVLMDAGKRASSGGRPALSWALDPDAWMSVAIAIEQDGLSWGFANAVGTMVDGGTRPAGTDPLAAALALSAELKAAVQERGIGRLSMAVGVPGAVKDGRVLTGDFLESWRGKDLEALFEESAGFPAAVENDLNAIALGYLKHAESGGARPGSLVYIHFNEGSCIGSGIVLDGRIFRGASNFSGEIGFLPMGGGRNLEDMAAEAGTDGAYAEAVVTALKAVNCIINPALIAVGGKGFRFDLGGGIRSRFDAEVDERLRPRLVFVRDSAPHYLAGLAAIAAERIFPR